MTNFCSYRRTAWAINGLLGRVCDLEDGEDLIQFIAAEVSWTETQEAVTLAIGEACYGLSARPDAAGYMTSLAALNGIPNDPWRVKFALKTAQGWAQGRANAAARRAAARRAAYEAQDEYDGMGWGHD